MNSISSLENQLNYTASHRVILINADDYHRPKELAYLNVEQDIIIIAGDLSRLHRWSGLHYPKSDIFRFVVRGCDMTTPMALAAQGLALVAKLPRIATMPWLVLSKECGAVLETLKINGIRHCKACLLDQSGGNVEPYKNVATVRTGPSQVTPLSSSKPSKIITQTKSDKLMGGGGAESRRAFKYSYPEALTDIGEVLSRLIVQSGGGYPITFQKLNKLIDQQASSLPDSVLTAVQEQRQRYNTVGPAMRLLAKQHGFITGDVQVVGVPDA
ncbi:hypothetical protein ACT3UJ_06475 [Halomonas sp. 86]|uniref:hypothetical protein n=1 Tax=unclassified Halomonas TaxID=2609666 RepID=UPI00403333D8